MLLSLMSRFASLLLLTLLFGCVEERITTNPYFGGTFVGHYLVDENAVPVGIRIQTEVTGVEEKRYILTGTATLGDDTYSVEGYEAASPNLDYITVQAPPPPTGNLVVNFKDASGSFAYSLCGTIHYGIDRIDTPYTFDGLSLSEDEPSDPYQCYFGTFATVTLEKLR